MKPKPVLRLPSALESAVQRIKSAARDGAERTIESLGLAALAATNAFQRDGLLGAQFELNRKSAVFVLAFNDAFEDRVLREIASRAGTEGSPTAPQAGSTLKPLGWDALSLVDDQEVESRIAAERLGMEIGHGCEWELRELDTYIGALLADVGTENERNPLRPEVIGHAVIAGIDAVSDRPEIRKVLSTEFSRSFGALLPSVYATVIADWRGSGVQPVGLAVRNRGRRDLDAATTRQGDEEFGEEDDATGETTSQRPPTRAGALARAGRPSAAGAVTRAGTVGVRTAAAIGPIDPALMSVIRRLAQAPVGGAGPAGRARVGYASVGEAHGDDDFGDLGGTVGPLPNLIRAHREELRQASKGGVDHMVIDVIGFLFDQILSDPKVPPQMARQIARLQLPVLRAALGDPSFFSTRKHPVRRFVNRIASLGAGFDDFADEAAQRLLVKVRELVQEVVEGDFEQIELYEQKLSALEFFVHEQASAAAGPAEADPAAVFSAKEDEIRLQQLYAQRLAGDLKDISAPEFLRDFVSRVWSQVLIRAAEQGGPEGALSQRLRRVGRELFLSVQAKATPAHRKTFLAELPRLMQDLTEGMNLVGLPDDQRRAFFGQLMPAHAEALKRPAAMPLEINMMSRRIEGALDRPLPSRADLKSLPAAPIAADEALGARFSADEARRVGLVDEAAVDWSAKVDIEVGAEADAGPPIDLPGLPGSAMTAEPAEPASGRALAAHVQVGIAYEMHLDDQWRKVRLAHISAGRAFFMFTYGGRHRKTVSLTQRMLLRLCDAGRLRAFEPEALLERAQQRARRQLAGIGLPTAAP